jgi:hypothetical protein
MAPKRSASEPLAGATPDCEPWNLGVAVMVVAMMMMALAGRKRGACTHQHQQGENDQLLHDVKRSTIPG